MDDEQEEDDAAFVGVSTSQKLSLAVCQKLALPSCVASHVSLWFRLDNLGVHWRTEREEAASWSRNNHSSEW